MLAALTGKVRRWDGAMLEATSVNSTERSPVSGLTPAGPGSPAVPSPGEWLAPIAPPPPEDTLLSSLSPTLPQLSSLTLPLASYGAPDRHQKVPYIHFSMLKWKYAFGFTDRSPGKVRGKLERAASVVGGIREPGRGGARYPIVSMLF